MQREQGARAVLSDEGGENLHDDASLLASEICSHALVINLVRASRSYLTAPDYLHDGPVFNPKVTSKGRLYPYWSARSETSDIGKGKVPCHQARVSSPHAV
jgi:hypothetical protein